MQTEVTLLTRDADVDRALTTHKPLIRHALVMLFARQDYLSLQTTKGRETLRGSALEAVQKILWRESGLRGVERVLFTEFVLQ